MCSVAAPPGLFVATPSQEPASWFMMGILVLFVAICSFKSGRSPAGSRERRRWAYIGLTMHGLFTGGAVELLVALPWQAALQAWHASELDLLLARGCSTAALNATYAQAMAVTERLYVAALLIQLCAGVFMLVWVILPVLGVGYYLGWPPRRSAEGE